MAMRPVTRSNLRAWSLFFVSLIAFDAVTLRRVHPLMATATLWFAASWGIVALV